MSTELSNKPPPAVLKCQWDKALFGIEQGDRSRMAYWVNRELYPTPLDESCSSGDQVRIDDDEMSTRAVMALSSANAKDIQHPIEREIKALTDDPIRQAWMARIANKLIAGSAVSDTEARGRSVKAEVIARFPSPSAASSAEPLRAFLRDVEFPVRCEAARCHGAFAARPVALAEALSSSSLIVGVNDCTMRCPFDPARVQKFRFSFR